MAVIVTNADVESLLPSLRQQAYNCMDSALTVGIHETLAAKLAAKPDAALVYAFERAMQGPAMTMAVRGIAVDEAAAGQVLGRLVMSEARVTAAMRTLAAVWMGDAAGTSDTAEIRRGLEAGRPPTGLNPHSTKAVPALFYGALEEGGCGERPYKRAAKRVANAEGGSPTPGSTANEDALLMLQARSPVVGVMAHLVLRARELRKLRSFVGARRSPDGRLRSSFNVGATTSGRWSFSKNCFRDGLNFGNIPKSARGMFVPSEPGWVMVNVDLKQAESYVNAYLCNDANYILDHETGDPHAKIAMTIYGHLMPLGALEAAWVRQPHPAVPKGKAPRQLCKGLAHGTPYGIQERKSSKLTGIPIRDIVTFREGFFGRYPGVLARIEGMPERLAASRRHVSLCGRPHVYTGHPRDPDTHRAALADEPQGIVADVLNVALWRLWRRHDVGAAAPHLRLLSQGYDSVLFECREEDVAAARLACEDAFNIPLTAESGATFTIPHDFGQGYSWAEACS